MNMNIEKYTNYFSFMNKKKALIIIFAVLVIDQISKIYIKTNFFYQESVEVFSWFKILFIENEGAAWGTKISDFVPVSEKAAKLILTLFRLVAISAIGYWLWDSIKKQAPGVLIFSVTLIFSGAVGNIIDSLFYGLIFDQSSTMHIASLFADDPYSGLFYGKVVDMFYFPLIDTVLPDWMPFVGGNHFRFFEPVFNVADTCISFGVFVLILFNKTAFSQED